MTFKLLLPYFILAYIFFLSLHEKMIFYYRMRKNRIFILEKIRKEREGREKKEKNKREEIIF